MIQIGWKNKIYLRGVWGISIMIEPLLYFQTGSGGLQKRRPSQSNRKSKDNGGDDKNAVDSILMDKLAEVINLFNE